MRVVSHTHITFIILASISSLNQTYAASFSPVDCDKAEIFAEKTICNDKKLNKLDQQMIQQITAAAEVTKVPQPVLDSTQQQWLTTRNQCQESSCIETSYQERLTELKRYNLTDQHFVQHFIRVQKDNSPTTALSVMELHKLDEKRIRVIINSYAPTQKQLKVNHITFNAYATPSRHFRMKDLDTKCLILVNKNTENKDIQLVQKNANCGAPHIRFSGRYQLVN